MFLLPLLCLVGYAVASAATVATTGTVTACATASVPAQTVSANGAAVGTIAGASSTHCETATVTIPTTTGATTTASTTTSTVAAPVVSGTVVVGSVVQCLSSDPSPAYRWQNDATGAFADITAGGAHVSKGYLIQSTDAGLRLRCVVNGIASASVAVPANAPTTTTTPTTTTPPPSGSVIFRGDFETGDISQWNWGGQCANTGDPTDGYPTPADDPYNRGTITVSGAYAQQGSYGAHVVLAADGARKQACEVLEHRPLVVDTWYGLAVKVGAGSTTNAWGTATAQLNYQGIWGPPEGLFAINSVSESEGAPDSLLMVLQSGFCYSVSTPTPGCTYVGSRYDAKGVPAKQFAIPPGQFHAGTAYSVVCHIHFATDSSGVYECWYRVRGDTAWILGGRYTGVPTVQWTSTPKLPSEDVDKIGAYRPPDSSSQWVVDLDGFVAASSFSAAASALP